MADKLNLIKNDFNVKQKPKSNPKYSEFFTCFGRWRTNKTQHKYHKNMNKKLEFTRNANKESITSLEYYITCRLFVETLEYLNGRNPQLPNLSQHSQPYLSRWSEVLIRHYAFGLYQVVMLENAAKSCTCSNRLYMRRYFDWKTYISCLRIIAHELYELESKESNGCPINNNA